jgi:hypothetical protein
VLIDSKADVPINLKILENSEFLYGACQPMEGDSGVNSDTY